MELDLDIYLILMILICPIVNYNMYKSDTTEYFFKYFGIAGIFMTIEIILFMLHLANYKLK